MGKSLKGVNLGKGISQRPDGRYHARAIVNGKRIEMYNKSLSQLKKDFEQAKAEALNGDISTNKDLKLAEYFDTWFNDYKKHRLKSEVSQSVYYRRVKNTYIELLGDRKVKDILHIDIQNTTNELVKKGYAYRTIREALGALRESFDIAVINHFAKHNPVVSINIRKENEAMQERRVLENWEMPLFIEEIKHDYYYEAYMILLSSGLRIGEFSALCWEDIDFVNKTINVSKSMSLGYVEGRKLETITTPKSQSSYRSIPFFDGTEELFKSWKVKQDKLKAKLGSRWRAKEEFGNLVFTTSLGSPASRYAISHSLAKIEKNMQLKENFMAKLENREARTIKHLHPHCLRHTFCTRCFEKGMSPIVIQALMGHSDFATTTSYLHVLNDKRQEEVAKIGTLF